MEMAWFHLRNHAIEEPPARRMKLITNTSKPLSQRLLTE